MKIKTIEKLDTKLSIDLTWRKKELIDIKTLIEDESNNINKKMLVRAGISLLCAHWEGYIRYAANMYVVYIGDTNIKTKDLKENFLALFLKKDIILSGETEKTSIHIKLINKLNELKEENFHIRYTDDNRIITTNSNLSFELFNEILMSINIENEYSLKKNYINSNLLKKRHEIVHGEITYLDKQDFLDTFKVVLEIMESFQSQLLYSAEHKVFLKEVDQF